MLLELVLPLSRFQGNRSSPSFLLQEQVELHENWFLTGQKVFLTPKFIEGHVIKVGVDYKSSVPPKFTFMHYQGINCIWNDHQCRECSASLFVLCWNARFDRSEIWGSSSFSLQHFAEAVRRWFISTVHSDIPHDIWIKVKSTVWGFLSAATLLQMPRLINVRPVRVHSICLKHVIPFAFAGHLWTCYPHVTLN